MRPEAKRNAFDRALADALDDALNQHDDDPDLWVRVLTGTTSVFGAGSDLTGEATTRAGGRSSRSARPVGPDAEPGAPGRRLARVTYCAVTSGIKGTRGNPPWGSQSPKTTAASPTSPPSC